MFPSTVCAFPNSMQIQWYFKHNLHRCTIPETFKKHELKFFIPVFKNLLGKQFLDVLFYWMPVQVMVLMIHTDMGKL